MSVEIGSMLIYQNLSKSVNDSGNLTGPQDQDARLVTLGTCICMFVLCVIGVYGNTVSVLIFTRSTMRSSINILLTALSAVDFFILVVAIPVFVIPGVNEYSVIRCWDRLYPFVIRFMYPAIMIAQTCSVWTFVIISVERYLAVCYPFNVARCMTTARAIYLQWFVFVSAVFYNLVRFWEYEGTQEKPWFQPYLRDNQYYFTIYATGLYLATHFAVPFLAILFLNVKIVRVMNVAQCNRRMLNPYQTQEYRTAQMVIIVTIMFGICNSLAFVINILEACDKDFFFGTHRFLAFLLLDISNILIILNSASTFVIYLIYCERYRDLFKGFNTCFYGYKNSLAKKFEWMDLSLEFSDLRSSFFLLRRTPRSSIFSSGQLSNSDYVSYRTNSFLDHPPAP